MTNNIEQLRTEVDNITNLLRELKDNVTLSELEKKDQAEALKAQADTARQKIENEIMALKDSTDSESIKNKNEAEALLDYFTEVTDLYNSIVNPLATPTSTSTSTPDQTTSDDRNIFVKAKDWVGDQWDAIWTKEKWMNEKGGNILRTAGFLVTGAGAVALAYKGVKELWKWAFSDDEETEESKLKKKKKKKKEKEEKEDETGFWDRWYGKAIKYSVIGTGIYYVIHGLKTGKWDFSHFFDWNQNGPFNNIEDNFDNYVDLFQNNPEKYKDYEQIGENINLMYDKIWDTERNYFGADSQIVMGEIGNMAKEQKIKKAEKYENVDTRGLVPYSLDNFFNNVGDMLSYGGVNRYIRSKNIEEYQQKIKSFGAEWFDKTMVPFLSSFVNFASFGIVSTDSAQQKMDKYLKGISENASENLDILDLFFRQYTKVLTYMADKKNALALKCAREILPTKGYGKEKWPSDPEEQNDMLYEAINDSDWLEQNLKNTKYGAFLSSNIVGAYKILKEEGLNNAEMTEELGDIVSDVDEKTAEIIGGFDDNAFVRAEAKLNGGGTLDESEKTALGEVADKVIEDLGDTKRGGWIYDTFDYGFELLDLSDADKQTILKESGIANALDTTASEIQSFQMEVLKNPTKENVAQLKELVGEYTSMKKEIAVALYAIQEAKENKDFGDYISQVWGAVVTGFCHFCGSINNVLHGKINVSDIINTFVGLTISGGMIEFGGRLSGKKWAVKLGQYTRKTGMVPCTLIDMGLGRTRRSYAVKLRINSLAKSNPIKAENLMKKKILDGILSKKHISSILQSNEGLKASLKISGFQDNDRVFKEVVYNIFGDKSKDQADLFIKYYRKVKGLVKYSPETMGNGGFTDGKFKMEVDEKFYKALKNFDLEFDKLGDTVQKSYFEHMLKKVRKPEEMELLDNLVRNDEFKKAINSTNLDKLRKLKISQLKMLEESGLLEDFVTKTKNIDEILDELKVIEKMKMTEARKVFMKDIDEAIQGLNELGNPRAVARHIKKLKRLKYDANLTDEEMEIFTKFMKSGFMKNRLRAAEIIPDLRKLFDIADTFGYGEYKGEKIGEKMKKLFVEGDYSEVKKILRSNFHASKFEKAGINKAMREGIVTGFDNVLKTLGHAANSPAAKNLVKGFFKVLAKAL